MKIIYCIYSTFNSGGMERVLMNKTNYLIEQLNDEVVIVTTDQKKRINFFPFSSKIRFIDLGINYADIAHKNIFIKIISLFFKQHCHKRKLKKILYAEKADICISMFCGEMNFLYKIKDGSKKILEYHFSKYAKIIECKNIFKKMLQHLRVEIIAQIVKKYDRFVVLTEEDKKAWGNISNTCVIPNSIVYYPKETADLSAKTVISIGRLSYQKGFDRLINIWAKISPHFPDWKLLIYGDGEERNNLQRLIGQSNLEGCILLKNAMKNIGEVYSNSSIYVLTSRYEGLPMVLLEAMSYGLPIVAFACPCGPLDVITEEAGCVIPNGNTDLFVKRLSELMENADLRREQGKNALRNSENYSHSKIMEKWCLLFQEVLQTK